MGLPLGAAKQACVRDGKDPSIMDLNPDKSLASQRGDNKNEDSGPPLRNDPEYEKVRFSIYLSYFYNSYLTFYSQFKVLENA